MKAKATKRAMAMEMRVANNNKGNGNGNEGNGGGNEGGRQATATRAVVAAKTVVGKGEGYGDGNEGGRRHRG